LTPCIGETLSSCHACPTFGVLYHCRFDIDTIGNLCGRYNASRWNTCCDPINGGNNIAFSPRCLKERWRNTV
jgi:hypothetical protein